MFEPSSEDEARSGQPVPKRSTFMFGESGSEGAEEVEERRRPKAHCPSRMAKKTEWGSQDQQKVARKLLFMPMLSSFEAVARDNNVEPRWLMDTAIVAATLVCEEHAKLFTGLLQRLDAHQKAGSLRCLRFTWFPMADETPTANRTTAPPSDDSDNAESVEDTSIAKIMAARMGFSMLLAEKSGEDEWSHVILHGRLPSRLRPMQSQQGPVVTEVLRDLAQVPGGALVEELFRDKHCLWTTDLHPSNLVAFRALAREMDQWALAHLRCGAHRLRTAELATLKVDAEVDSFFLHTTLHLNNPGVMQQWRRRARCFVRENVVVKVGEPPEEVTQWRESLVGPLRGRANDGACSGNLVQKLVALDTWFTGDIRKSGTVEHYHNANCPRDDAMCKKMCARQGVKCMLRKPPRYSRRSWHGQHQAVDEIVLLAATHGLLRHAQPDRKRPHAHGRSGPHGSGVGADIPEFGADGAHHMDVEADKRASLHEEAEAHANRFVAFLQRQDHLLRMLRYRTVVYLFADVRAPVLERAGEEWEAQQLCSQDRTYAIVCAFESEHIFEGMERLTHMGGGAPELAANDPWRQLPPGVCFTMAARGAGSLWELGWREQQRYPAPLYALLHGCAEDAEAVLDDAQKRPHLLDAVSASHCAVYSTPEALLSKESLACLESQALILQESTQWIEHGHAEVKRSQHCREQTHKERTSLASAMRILHTERCDATTLLPRTCRPAPDNAEEQPPQKRRRKTRKHGLWQGWLALQDLGRTVTTEDSTRYRNEIQDPDVRERCKSKAEELDAAAILGHRPKRDRRLRTLREKAQARGKPWCKQRAEAQLAEEDRRAFIPFQRRKMADWRQKRKGKREIAAKHRGEVKRFAEEVVGAPGLDDKDAVAHRTKHADRGFWYMPDVRETVLDTMPSAMAGNRMRRVSSWGRLHHCMLNQNAPPVRPQTAAQAQRAKCALAGVCLCTGSQARRRLAFTLSLRQCLTRLLRKEDAAMMTLRGPNEMRIAADQGKLIIKIHDDPEVNAYFHHVCFLRYNPCRPVLLRLARASPSDGAAEPIASDTFRPMFAPQGFWSMAFDCSAYLSLDLSKPQRICLYEIRDTRVADSGFLLRATPFRRSDRLIWKGDAARVPDAFPWEKEEAAVAKAEDDSSSSSSSSSSTPTKGEVKVARSVDPDHAAKPMAKQRKSGSNQEWARNLVPGHTSDEKAVLPPGTQDCTLNQITRHSGETSWVARFWGENLQVVDDLGKKDKKLRNKTRSQHFGENGDEHDAFRTVLFWLWRKWLMHNPTGKPMTLNDLPEEVRKCLAPFRDGELQPCPGCRAGECTIMTTLRQRRVAASRPEARKALDAVGAPERHAPKGIGAPEPDASVCVCCGGRNPDRTQAGLRICKLCIAVDAKAKAALPGAKQPKVLRLPCVGVDLPNCEGGQGWSRIRVPPDGDCLFSSLSMSFVAIIKATKPLPDTMEKRAQWGSTTRSGFCKRVRKMAQEQEQVLGVASVETLIEAGTGMTIDAYLRRMAKPDPTDLQTWGGFLEATLLAHNWRCRLAIFDWIDGPALRVVCGQNQTINPKNQHHGWIALLWTGSHYDALHLDEGLLTRLDQELRR